MFLADLLRDVAEPGRLRLDPMLVAEKFAHLLEVGQVEEDWPRLILVLIHGDVGGISNAV